jgi:hypothetical protein
MVVVAGLWHEDSDGDAVPILLVLVNITQTKGGGCVQKVERHVAAATKVQGVVVSLSAVEGVPSSEDGAVVLPTRSLPLSSSLSSLSSLSLAASSSLHCSL